MLEISLFPHMIEIFGIYFSKTFITSVLATVFFVIFVLIYNFIKKRSEKNIFVQIVNLFVEGGINFFEDIGVGLPRKAKLYIIFLFFYILWINVFGVVGDMFAFVIPSLHHIFRPVATDITFNLVLAVVGVVWSIVYGFSTNGFSFIQRYIPYKGLGFVDKVTGVGSFIVKIFDILLALFIGLLEFVNEFTKILSLTLRLFGNILAGVVLVGLIVAATIAFIKVPFIGPLFILVMELFISFLQAFVFALLVLVYFKMAESGH